MNRFGKWDAYNKMPSNLQALTFTMFLHDFAFRKGVALVERDVVMPDGSIHKETLLPDVLKQDVLNEFNKLFIQ